MIQLKPESKLIVSIYYSQEKLNMVRVYTKPRGRVPDYTAPVVLPRTKCTVEEYVLKGSSMSRVLYSD